MHSIYINEGIRMTYATDYEDLVIDNMVSRTPLSPIISRMFMDADNEIAELKEKHILANNKILEQFNEIRELKTNNERLRERLERVASSECFHLPTAKISTELKLRMEYAREALKS